MRELNRWMEEACTALRADSAFSGVAVGTADPLRPVGQAETLPRITLEQGAVTVAGRYLGDATASGTAKRATAAVRFHIDVPFHRGAARCGELFSAVCEALLFDPGYGIVRMTAAPAKLLRERHCFRMEVTALLELTLSAEGGNG